MPPKRPLLHNVAKKAPKPAATKKKQTPAKPTTAKNVSAVITKHLTKLLKDKEARPQTIADFVLGPSCGLERRHTNYGDMLYGDATSFLVTAQCNRLDVLQLLFEHSPNASAVDARGWTAFHHAAHHGNSEMLRCLVEHNGSLIDTLDYLGSTPLHNSFSNAHDITTTALLLLDLGANPHISNESYYTPLHLACMVGLVDVVKALLAKGVQVDRGAGSRNTPLHFAIDGGHSSLVILLLEAGADPRITNIQQDTPLHRACRYGLVDVARALLSKGALVDALNSQGKTPLDLAIESNHQELVTILKETSPTRQ